MFLLRILARDFDQYSSNLRKLILKPFRHQKQIVRRILGGFYLKENHLKYVPEPPVAHPGLLKSQCFAEAREALRLGRLPLVLVFRTSDIQ